MSTIAVLDMTGKEVGNIELNDAIFAVEVNENVLHEYVRAHLANKRQGTQSSLTRSEVRGGGIKPWRQKGTGRARQGSIRSPQWRHGGVVFAPKPRDYSVAMNKKAKRLALKSALSAKVQGGDMLVLDTLTIKDSKTKEMSTVLKALNAKKALVITQDVQDDVVRAARNIPGVETTIATTLNPYDILKYDTCIVTKDAVKKIEEVYA